jgi:hypothetical protein
MLTSLRFQGNSSQLNQNAAVQYVVMRLEDLRKASAPLFYKVMRDSKT